MGRELRRVPANWNHPVVVRGNGHDGFQPMHRDTFESAAKEWKEEFAKWEAGERPDYYTVDEENPTPEYWEYNGEPPERKYYRPWADEEATWYQVWETVSEGTPVSPPFETQAELIDYLVANGDFWDQSRRAEGRTLMPCGPWSRKSAEAFVLGCGWAPSGVVANGKVMSGVEALAEL